MNLDLLELIRPYLLVFFRISAFVMSMPAIGNAMIPATLRIILSVALTIFFASYAHPSFKGEFLSFYGFFWLAREICLGLCIGLILQIAFHVMVMLGQTVAMQVGLGFSMMVDPGSGVQLPLLSQFLVILGNILFFKIDGHLTMIKVLSESFSISKTKFFNFYDLWHLVVNLSSEMFVLSLKLSLSVIIVIYLLNATFGIVARIAPQTNVITISFPISLIFGLGALLLSMPHIVDYFIDFSEQSILVLRHWMLQDV